MNHHDQLLAQYPIALEEFHRAYKEGTPQELHKAETAVVSIVVEAGPYLHTMHVGEYHMNKAGVPLF